MLEAKKPEVVFACWRVKDLDLRFSGKGLGRADQVERLTLSNGNGLWRDQKIKHRPTDSLFLVKEAMELGSAPS
jgi:hypothetical protein